MTLHITQFLLFECLLNVFGLTVTGYSTVNLCGRANMHLLIKRLHVQYPHIFAKLITSFIATSITINSHILLGTQLFTGGRPPRPPSWLRPWSLVRLLQLPFVQSFVCYSTMHTENPGLYCSIMSNVSNSYGKFR